MNTDDMELLRQYTRLGSEEAFAALVSRHVHLVYSVALRQTGNTAMAEEIAQAVFIILARKAESLGDKTILPGWLCRTARNVAANALTIQRRRQHREQEAYMENLVTGGSDASPPTNEETWARIAPLLEAALARLGGKDHDAIVLRFFENKELKQVGATLGVSEDAAKKRVSRALEKLRRFFFKRGVDSTTASIAETISANSIQAAPVALAKTATAVALAKGAAAPISTLTLIKGALKIMAWTKAKTVVVAGIAVLFAGSATTLVVTKTIQRLHEPAVDESFWQGNNFLKAPPVLILRLTKPDERGGSGVTSSSGKALELNANLKRLLSVAYDIPESRMILPDNLPTNHFDLLLTLNSRPREALQEVIKKRFGLAGRMEARDTDGYLMKIKTAGAPGLSPASREMRGSFSMSSRTIAPGAGNTSAVSNSAGSAQGGHSGGQLPPAVAAGLAQWRAENAGPGEHINLGNLSLADLARFLDQRLGHQVIDQTETSNRFDIKLQVMAKPDESADNALKRCVQEQLGLDLISTNLPVEMLVVEKAN